MPIHYNDDVESSLTDEELIELYRANDGAVYMLIRKYASSVSGKAAYLSSVSGVDADDLVQEGFLGLINAIRTYRPDGGASFSTYAGKCVENKMRTAIKKQSRADIPSDSEMSEGADDITPETLFFDKESSDEVGNVITGHLSKLERRIFTLFLRGASYEEISAKTGVSVKSVDNALQRSRKKLKEAFVAGTLFNKS